MCYGYMFLKYDSLEQPSPNRPVPTVVSNNTGEEKADGEEENMKISKEILKWLNENAYAVKGEDYYFLPDFPQDKIPDRLEIPMGKRNWQRILSQ